ncbi:MAG: hypothetical protein AAF487_06675 [Bacteroidota bacterium]
MRYYLLIAVAMLFALNAGAQSKTIEGLEKNDEEGRKVFFYESYIRMLNLNDDPNYYKLVEDIEFIKGFLSSKEGDSAKSQYRELQASIVKEGFEEVFMAEDKKGFATIYLREIDGEEEWVALLFGQGSTAALEMKGSLNLKYLNGLDALNQDMLESYLKDKSFTPDDWD